MEERDKLHISVRNLVEFIFREGDIDNRGGTLQSADAMLMGTKIHKQIQKSMGREYQAEVPLSITEERPLYDLTIEGRADGIFTAQVSGETEGVIRAPGGEEWPGEEELFWIDEIKGTYRRLERIDAPDYVHLAQAMCYAYIFSTQNDLPAVGVRLTYCQMEPDRRKGYSAGKDSLARRYFYSRFTIDQLKRWYDDLMEEYGKWADFRVRWRRKRQSSIKSLVFPYPYRKGQFQLAGDVYRTIARKKNLFLEAPTGVGKTLCTLFPAVKAVGEELAERIFYLTAKTVCASVALQTFQLFAEQGFRGKVIRLTAKEKICLCGETECNPISCPFAAGHYDRVNDAVYDLLERRDTYTREIILDQAQKYRVCPFEMSLDLAEFADAIIGDYNYVFDPDVALKRFFQDGGGEENIFLVDEAHNLVERSRKMYSAGLVKEDLLEAKRLLDGKSPKLTRYLNRCNRQMLAYKRECQDYVILKNGIGDLYFSIFRLAAELGEFLQFPGEFPGRKTILDLYFTLRSFLNIYDLVDEHYVVYSRLEADGRFRIVLFCVDPSANLQKRLDMSRSTIFFSATLIPVSYYKSLLSTETDNYAIYAESVFDPAKRLLLLGRDVSTRYSQRNPGQFARIAEYIFRVLSAKSGNYMFFFPSYRLMEQVYDAFLALDPGERFTCVLQTPSMNEEEREEFLAYFQEERTDSFAAFCVMGGIFAEGIDLTGDRLIGSVVVGTGLPQVGLEREILKNYYDARGGRGFDYAYRYPGMNKVLQSAGRVIRTTDDEGVILLLDQRFTEREYQMLFPREWADWQGCNLSDVEEKLKGFWKRKKEDE